MFKFLLRSGFIWIDPKDFDSNKYRNNSSTGCVLKIHLEYPKKLHKLHNNYPLASYKIEIKEQKCCLKYQLTTSDFYNTPIGNVKKLVPNFFDKEKYVLYYQSLLLYLGLN